MTVIDKILKSHEGREGALLPILHDIQSEFGHIPDNVIENVANSLKLSRAQVYGVIHFYHDFRTEPAGNHVLKICRAEACQSMGSESLIADTLAAFGMNEFGTSADGNITIEAVYCLGLCAMSPAALLDQKPLGHATIPLIKEALK